MKKEFIPWACPDIGEEEIQAVAEAVKSTWIGGNGPLTREFEQKIREKLNVNHAIAVSNGTSALMCALQAFLQKLGKNLAVGIPTFTFVATANAAFAVCGTPILFDLDVKTWNIDKCTIIKNRENHKILDLVMPVDVCGNPVNYDELKKLGLPIIADSAEAMGACYKGNPVGNQADVHCFSLHSAKIITTGEGGLITTNDAELYELMCSLVNQGYGGKKEPWEYIHQNIGFNYRMTEMQSALGLVQLRKLDRYVKGRREKAKIYMDILGEKVGYQTPIRYSKHPYFIFAILVKNQIKFCKEMYKSGVQVKVTWLPVHKQPFYKGLYKGESFPEAEWIAGNVVSLPIWNGLNEEKIKYIAETARKVAE